MAFQTKNSVIAIKEETTEGVYVAPTAATDYIPVRTGYSVTNSVEQLENDALTGSIGVAKPAVGLESPTADMPLYLHASGTVGVAPDIAQSLKGFFGSETIATTEYDTVAASTTSVIKVDAGEGVNFQRGQSLLIKDNVNGWKIRPVLSVSTDDLNLGFQVTSAPASGVNLGRSILYKPESSVPSFSLTAFQGNGALIDAVAGAKVSGINISATAGQFIEFSSTYAGIKYFQNPLTVGATNNALDFNDGGAQSITLTQKTYQDPHALAAELQSKMDGASSDNITVVYNDVGVNAGKFTVTTDGAALSIDWATTVNTCGPLFGFTADDTAALTYTSDNALILTSPYTPSFDAEKTLTGKDQGILIGDANDLICVDLETIEISGENTINFANSICSESGRGASAVTGRSFEITVTGEVKAYDGDYFKKLRTGDNTPFFAVFGVRESAGGNWVPNKNVTLYAPNAVITALETIDTNELVYFTMTIRPYVESGLGEFYINQV